MTEIFKKFPGGWELKVHPNNVSALVFREKVIDNYTKGNYQKIDNYEKAVYSHDLRRTAFKFFTEK